jgi:hypothetical protein
VCEDRGVSTALIKTNVYIGITPMISSDIFGHIKGLIRTFKQSEFILT